jgi:hypothetical protein
MEEVCERANLIRAWKCVRANQGSPGVDGRTVQGGPLSPWLRNVVLDELDRELTRRGIASVAMRTTATSTYAVARRANE